MTAGPGVPLRPAIVLRPGEDACEVSDAGELRAVHYSAPFKPRADRITPGHVVAIASASDDSTVIVWRWFDAVVIGEEAGHVRLWEPAHGEVLARPRLPAARYRPGSRAYLSAGLPGADWWVAGAVADGRQVEVELADVHRFYIDHDLWDQLT